MSTLGADGQRTGCRSYRFLAQQSPSLRCRPARCAPRSAAQLVAYEAAACVRARMHAMWARPAFVRVACVPREQGRKRVHPSDLRGAGFHTAADGTGCTRGLGCRMCSPCPAAEVQPTYRRTRPQRAHMHAHQHPNMQTHRCARTHTTASGGRHSTPNWQGSDWNTRILVIIRDGL